MNENAKKWVAALRSGQYKQTRNTLTRVEDDGSLSHCCMGVACQVAMENGLYVNFKLKPKPNYNQTAVFLPVEVGNWLGLTTTAGTYGNGCKTLVNLNDHEKRTFAEIADVIESEPPGLFCSDLDLPLAVLEATPGFQRLRAKG